ncbi:hypothetical protein [Thiolapillus sp.]|uniref:hypothetical protein n=1 Tax=Thiolapillus sp. TaxID=2017437 RepID=UPI003AF5D5C8
MYENFKGLFKAIDQGNKHLGIPAYNGGLFAPDEALDALVVSDAVCESVNELAEYDFCRVPCDHIPKKSYPLFRTRQILNDWLSQNQEEA